VIKKLKLSKKKKGLKMKKVSKILIGCLLITGITSSSLMADAAKGQKLYIKKLKKSCGIPGGIMAQKHTQDEWKELKENNSITKELKTICPNIPEKSLKSKYIPHYYDFFYEFANDSGNVPSC
jgi:hypothetical protein